MMDKTPTYFDEENEDGTRLPATFPEEALTDGDVLYAEPFDELGDLPGHVPMGSERGCILGLNVELLRKGAKLSKVRFCALVGISRPMLDKIERGESNPRLDLLTRLADVLGVPVSRLITPPWDDVDEDFYRQTRLKKPPRGQ
ncbi:helix-turn-helix domain-containing protein [Enterorhabdus sp. P55]|jgi:DNA-binding XRE family transcriptional regulator|uniref:helix-turn-helix domain-containing protein n=1 Tax=Enterorhabdus sp. P55 TaxID=2304571 RepID=UPI00191C263B|nr:helix-turn-helix transcriptional regulator [Enterorhabdus sp. P55]